MRLAVLGDLHFANYSNPLHVAARDRLFREMFRQVAAQQPDIVLAVGDITNYGTVEEMRGLQQAAADAGVKLLAIIGNHDANLVDKSELAPFFLGGRTPVIANELYTSFDYDLVRFVLLDTTRPKLSNIDWSGFVSDEQLAWLRSEIARFNADTAPQYLVVVGHHPLYGLTYRAKMDKLHITNSEPVAEIFATLTRTPGVYLCGHNHSNSIKGPDAHNWYHIQSGAPLDCQSFRVITFAPDKIELATVDFDLSDPQVRADYELTGASIEADFTVQITSEINGRPRDRELLVEFIYPN